MGWRDTESYHLTRTYSRMECPDTCTVLNYKHCTNFDRVSFSSFLLTTITTTTTVKSTLLLDPEVPCSGSPTAGGYGRGKRTQGRHIVVCTLSHKYDRRSTVPWTPTEARKTSYGRSPVHTGRGPNTSHRSEPTPTVIPLLFRNMSKVDRPTCPVTETVPLYRGGST